MKTFWIRVVNVVAIAVILSGYNTVLAAREKDDEIAKLNAELKPLSWNNRRREKEKKLVRRPEDISMAYTPERRKASEAIYLWK